MSQTRVFVDPHNTTQADLRVWSELRKRHSVIHRSEDEEGTVDVPALLADGVALHPNSDLQPAGGERWGGGPWSQAVAMTTVLPTSLT